MATNENGYADIAGVKLDPRTHVDPQTGLPMPILVLPLGGASTEPPATEATLTTVLTTLEDISASTALSGSGVTYIPEMYRYSTLTAVAPGAYEVCVANMGTANGYVLGITLKPGEIVEFRAPTHNDTLGVIALNGVGTDLLVTVIRKAV